MELITPSFGLLFWMTLIFAIVFFILAKFGFPVITGMVERRRDHINKSLEDAAKAKAQLDGMQQEYQKMLSEARSQQEEMLAAARASASRIVEDAKQEASDQAKQIIAQASSEIELRRREAMESIKADVAKLAVAVSEKVLRRELSGEAAQKEYMDKLVDEISKNE